MHPAVPHALMLAAKSLDAHIQIATQRLNNEHELAVLELRRDCLRDLIEGSIKKLDVLQQHCAKTLELFAEQARSYIEQQGDINAKLGGDLSDEILNRLHRRQAEIDTRLAEIRADAQLLFARMGILINQLDRVGVRYSDVLVLPPPLRDC